MYEAPTSSRASIFHERELGRRFLLWLGLAVEIVLMAVGLWPAVWLVLRFGPSATAPLHWVLIILGAVLLFNYGYLVALLALRIVLPRPEEGLYPYRPGERVPGPVLLYMLNLLLVKARYDPPWAAMFSSVLANTFPLDWLFIRFFGPRTWSLTMGDTTYIIDPHLVEIGQNVQLGFQCVILAHHFDNRGLRIGQVKIGDHAVIGGQALLMAGVQVGHHALVATRAMVYPNTIIKPYEYWAGAPAKKIKDLEPGDEPPAAEAADEPPTSEPSLRQATTRPAGSHATPT